MGKSGDRDNRGGSYEALIHDHLPFIEKQCFRAVRFSGEAENRVQMENEALELFNRVLDSLSRDDFRVLRSFKGDAKFTTYLTAIISRAAVDVIRKKRGRDRSRERARKFGELGEIIHRRIIREGQPAETVFDQLPERPKSLSLEEFQEMAERIAGTGSNPNPPQPGSHEGVRQNQNGTEEGKIEAVDAGDTPEEAMLEEGRKRMVNDSLAAVMQGLTGRERLMLRMRFPTESL